MQFQQNLKLTATPQGVLLNDLPLTKSILDILPERTLRHIARANELISMMKPEDWGSPKPHGPDSVPILAMAKMHAALGAGHMAQAFAEILSKFDPDQPRDEKGRWTATGDTGNIRQGRNRFADGDMVVDNKAGDGTGRFIAVSDDTSGHHRFFAPGGSLIFQPRRRRSNTGFDAIDNAGAQSPSWSISWPSSTSSESSDSPSTEKPIPDDRDKDICEREYEYDRDKCYDKYGNGLRGAGFKSSLHGCLEWASYRQRQCYRGKKDPGEWPGYAGDNKPWGNDK
jgi:hypothetical protein